MATAIKFDQGQRFSKLVIIGPTGEFKDSRRLWLCQCDCGNQAKIIAKHLTHGLMKSCGCLGGVKSFAVGHRVGRLVVVGLSGESDHRGKLWSCQCDCGNTAKVPAKYLKNGFISSCGCLAKDNHQALKERNTTHGQAGSLLYRLWRGLIDRCHNAGSAGYSYYGARGIEVCPKWRTDFARFVEDMGQPELGESLDRIDVDGPYCKGNCRWSSHQEQMNNIRNNRTLTHHGVTKTLSQWARDIGISRSAIEVRVRSGWSVERILETPVRMYRDRALSGESEGYKCRSATRAYQAWEAMIQRCTNKNSAVYRNYGGRGIQVCEDWRNSFQSFLDDMGDRPVGHSLERTNVNGDYCKENCSWATVERQANNKRNSHILTHNGLSFTVSEWAERLGTTRETLIGRIRLGWSVDRVLDSQVRSCKRRT